jgi:hypothetical protein
MASTTYTAKQLYEGTSSIDLTAGIPYTFILANNSGSSYFTMETPFNYLFNGSTPKNTSGSFTSTGSVSPVKSDYVVGFAVPQTSSYSFVFTPATNVTGSSLKLRGTGGISLNIYSYIGFNYVDFASISDLTLVGDVTQTSNQIYLTTLSAGSTGNLYRSLASNYNRNFSVNWSSYIGGGTGADGYCLQWTTTKNSTGVGGGGVGRIANSTTINAITFNTVGTDKVVLFSSNVQIVSTNVANDYWRQLLYFWADYNHSTQTLNLYYNTINTKPGSPNQQYTNFVFDDNLYYIGFGGATGADVDNHNILSWSLNFS